MLYEYFYTGHSAPLGYKHGEVRFSSVLRPFRPNASNGSGFEPNANLNAFRTLPDMEIRFSPEMAKSDLNGIFGHNKDNTEAARACQKSNYIDISTNLVK